MINWVSHLILSVFNGVSNIPENLSVLFQTWTDVDYWLTRFQQLIVNKTVEEPSGQDQRVNCARNVVNHIWMVLICDIFGKFSDFYVYFISKFIVVRYLSWFVHNYLFLFLQLPNKQTLFLIGIFPPRSPFFNSILDVLFQTFEFLRS